MSIISAYISPRSGVVASDGRMFAPAYYTDGQLLQSACIEREDFDKTFDLRHGKVVGAFCGLVSFGCQTIGDHARRIADVAGQSCRDLTSLATVIAEGLRTALDAVEPDEVSPEFWSIELLLAGGHSFRRSDVRTVHLRLAPDQGATQTSVDEVHPDRGRKWFYVAGDCPAQHAAKSVFQADVDARQGTAYLTRTALAAIADGIRATGPHPSGTQPACGGQTFARAVCH